LGKKLKEIRLRLGFTQEQMTKALNRASRGKTVLRGYVSQFETSQREPSLLILLAYARLGAVTIDYLADDKMG
jgi:transcriptional regulator with XRE-family HTH domain